MRLKRVVYILSKVTLLDEILGFLYWAFALYGIFLISEHNKGEVLRVLVIIVYILAVTLTYFGLLKRIKNYFKETKGKKSG